MEIKNGNQLLMALDVLEDCVSRLTKVVMFCEKPELSEHIEYIEELWKAIKLYLVNERLVE
jgi:hypothetical protein